MNLLFKKFLGPRQTEYLLANHALIVQEISPGVQRFAEDPSEARQGIDVRTIFPELIGIENILMSIVLGAKPSFELKGVARFSESTYPLYFDILVLAHEEEHQTNKLLILFEDATERMVMKQSLVQKANEANLLLSALTASRDYVDKIIRSMADALLVTTTLGTIKKANRAAQLLFGYSELELIDLPLSMIVIEEELLYQARHRYILSQKELARELEVACTTRSGEEIWVEFSCSAIQTEFQGLYDFVYIGRNITERKQQEIEIRHSLAKEQELRAVKSRFFSMIAHEFGNPLNTVLFSTQILKEYGEEITNAEKDQYLDHVKTASKHMAQLLDDLRLLSSAEAGQLQFNPAPLDLPKFCADLVEGVKISFGKNHTINFVDRKAESDKKTAKQTRKHQRLPAFDKKLLRHILTNLLGNAVKYSEIDSNIYFELSGDLDRATFKIKDEGIGIPEKDREQLFESYYRAENVGKRPGTGLGLSIVKQCVELHGGKIEFVSKVGVGTTFTVTIPCYQKQETLDS
ncbi:MAG: PAS domain-containing sensor histidine kinase [Oscillatoriaceae cyanobacterium Prado104]|jgi:PAS domain S-box-containing protein|nr:PAS domain-containing sensor histidine kinase [Oscillatoriaceae cyanobacterium Prado104]